MAWVVFSPLAWRLGVDFVEAYVFVYFCQSLQAFGCHLNFIENRRHFKEQSFGQLPLEQSCQEIIVLSKLLIFIERI